MSESIEVVVARLEEGQKYLIQMMEAHIDAGCSGTDCKLNDRVVVLETTVKNNKRGIWATVLMIFGLFVKGLFPNG